MALRVRHPDVEVDAQCVDEAQYLASYAPAGWALVVDADGVPVQFAETDGAAGDPAPIPVPVAVELDPEEPESPVSNPEPRPDPADFVDFDAIGTEATPASDDSNPATPSEED